MTALGPLGAAAATCAAVGGACGCSHALVSAVRKPPQPTGATAPCGEYSVKPSVERSAEGGVAEPGARGNSTKMGAAPGVTTVDSLMVPSTQLEPPVNAATCLSVMVQV